MKKRTLTLIEIMIVIVLIGLIGSVIGVNMKGSLDEGRAFKTRQARQQIRDILMLAVAQGPTMEEVVAKHEEFLKDSGLVKNPKKFLQDGWGKPFEIKVEGGKIVVFSDNYVKYLEKKKIKVDEDQDDGD